MRVMAFQVPETQQAVSRAGGVLWGLQDDQTNKAPGIELGEMLQGDK